MLPAGERYYRRQHIEINDFYPLDMSGYGGGMEDLNVKIGMLAVAYLPGARPDIVTANGVLAKGNVDVRLYDVKGPLGQWAGWFDSANSKGGTTTATTTTAAGKTIPAGTAYPTSNGYAFGIRHQRLEWHGGYHGHVDYSRCRVLQLRYVPHNFQPWRGGVGPADWQRVRPLKYGHCRWRHSASNPGRDCRSLRSSPRLCFAGDLLSIYSVLRFERIEAQQHAALEMLNFTVRRKPS